MNKLATKSLNEEKRHEAVDAAILVAIDAGTYDPSRTPAELAERFDVDLHTVQQITFGMIGRHEITQKPHPATGGLRMVLTKIGRERLARSAETC